MLPSMIWKEIQLIFYNNGCKQTCDVCDAEHSNKGNYEKERKQRKDTVHNQFSNFKAMLMDPSHHQLKDFLGNISILECSVKSLACYYCLVLICFPSCSSTEHTFLYKPKYISQMYFLMKWLSDLLSEIESQWLDKFTMFCIICVIILASTLLTILWHCKAQENLIFAKSSCYTMGNSKAEDTVEKAMLLFFLLKYQQELVSTKYSSHLKKKY